MSILSYEIKKHVEEKNYPLYSICISYPDRESESITVRESGICKNSYSVAKLFTTSAIGLLCDKGAISTDDRILDILGREISDETKEKTDKRWEDVTVHMLLRHGIALPPGFLDIDCEDANHFGRDYLSYILTYPLCGGHGEKFTYTDAAFYLLSRCAEVRAGKRLDEFLWNELFYPLSFREAAFSSCPMGHSMGATGLYISTEDMAKLGRLYLDGGKYKGKTVLSKKWVDTVFERGYELRCIKDDIYGKGGMLGQMLALYKNAGVSVAWHGYRDFDADELFDRIRDLL